MHHSYAPLALLLSLLLGPVTAQAQLELYYDGSIPVQRSGVALDLAWAGGLNSVQLNDIDLNGDGHKDLLLFDRHGDKVTTLLNNGSSGPLAYSVTRAYDHLYPLPELHDWVLLRDFNCDGKEDIFSYSLAGFSVYKNMSTGDVPAFEQVKYRVNSDYVSPSGAVTDANLYVAEVDLPGIEDVDGDGDLDILSFSLLGSYMEYHKNLSMETYGNCDSLKFELRNKCWGFFVENLNNNAVTLNAPCGFNVPAPEMGTGGGTEDGTGDGVAKANAHAGSTVLPLDLDGDGVKELLLGDISYNNLVGLYNGGTVELAHMTEEDTLFPSYDVSTDLPIFPGAYYEDVNNDGKRDLVVSPNATSLSQNFRSMWYYTNTGTDASPVFERVQEDLFQDRMLEFGEGAFPVPFDHDGDGLMDLIVANHGYYAPGAAYVGKLALLRNTGTATAPAFSYITDDYMDLSTSGIGLSMYPAFGDVDGDGDKDMYIGDLQGRMHFFRNTAAAPPAQFVLTQANITDVTGEAVDVGQFATPQFQDMDGDGLLDLVIGERNGNLSHYRNTGTAALPAWTLISEDLGGVNVAEYWNITGFSVPCIFRNTQGEREIMLGSEAGWLHHYGGIEGNVGGTWTLLDSTFMDIREGGRTGLCLHDFTGDAKLDMVVGNYRGGLSFWRSELPTDVNEPLAVTAGAFTIVPNPATAQADLVLNAPPAAGSTWVVRNGLGQEVARTPALVQRSTLSLLGLAEGIYLVRLEGSAISPAQRLVVVR